MKPPTNRKKSTVAPRPVRQWESASRRLINQIELLQMRVAATEDTWKEAKAQHRQAKRRRKLAKLFARRAKKDVKSARANLDLARKSLAAAKAQAAILSWRATSRKVSQAKDGRPLDRKPPVPRKSLRNLAPAAGQPASQKPSPSLPTKAEGIPGYPNPAASPPAIRPGENPGPILN